MGWSSCTRAWSEKKSGEENEAEIRKTKADPRRRRSTETETMRWNAPEVKVKVKFKVMIGTINVREVEAKIVRQKWMHRRYIYTVHIFWLSISNKSDIHKVAALCQVVV